MIRLPLRVHSSSVAAHGRHCCRSCPSFFRHQSFSTHAATAEKKESKSPHSKLLRVCSSRNVNPHFAAIEGEMLRLNWDKSMKLLVADWAKNKRFDEFVELERNVKSYVEKNLPFITLDREDDNHTKSSVLLGHYPYESIISSCVRFAITAPDKGSVDAPSGEFDKNEAKFAIFDLQKRMEALATAGKLLEALTSTLETEQAEDGDEAADTLNSYYKSCTNCYRLVVSGWFLLFRQQKTLHDKIIAELNASDILSTTSKLKILPDGEAYAWANTWISFNSRCGRGGILPSDEPIFRAISKVLLTNREDVASEFDEKLKELFLEDNSKTN